jgi:hypothetical protein
MIEWLQYAQQPDGLHPSILYKGGYDRKSMTPDEIISAFDKASSLAVDLMKTHRGQPMKPLVVEAKMRLEQSTMLLREFRRAEGDLPAAKNGRINLDNVATRIRLYGEAFYYFAWRAREALAKCGVKFTPKGVLLVRNRMIEHPDKHDGILVLAWMFDCPQGLVLEPGGPGTPGADPGLYPNAQEYIEKLLPRLEAAIS